MLAHLASLVEQDAWEHTWEDEDDDEPQKSLPAPIFQAGSSLPSSVRRVVVGLYGAGATFLSAIYADRLQSPMASISLPPAKEEGKSEELATVHQIDESTLVVLSAKAVPADRAFTFGKLLFENLPTADETLILHSLGRHEYRPASDEAYLSPSTFRLIETQAAKQKRDAARASAPCPFLEVPNMVDGAAAAIFSTLERRGHVGRLVISVLGEEPGGRLGLEAVQGFQSVLTAGGEHQLLPLTEEQAKRVDSIPAAVKAFNAQLPLLKTNIFL